MIPALPARLLLVAAAFASATSGCIIPLGDGDVGDLLVGWSFNGDTRCTSLGIDSVTVQVTSEESAGGVEAACETGSALLKDLPVGHYKIALDARGQVSWQGGESIDVVANQVANEGIVKLKPTIGVQGADVKLAWTFGGDASCARSRVSAVDVEVRDGETLLASKSFACTDGGATLTGLPGGELKLDVAGRVGELVAFEGTANASTSAFPTDLGVIDLVPTLASVDVRWNFAGDPRCEVAGVSQISVQVLDDNDNTVTGTTVDCLVGTVRFAALPTEHLTFIVEGLEQGQRVWTNATAQTLTPGVNDDVVVPLERAFATAQVRWLFALPGGASGDCGEAGVSTVNIEVFDGAGDAVAGASFACTIGVGTITGLDPVNHRFVADGISQAGALVFSEATGDPRGVVSSLVLGDNEVVVTLEDVP